jgi:hypothetical protein
VAEISQKHIFILYALLKYITAINRRFDDKPLEASVSKIFFIKHLLESGIVEKTKRGLYKNLEALEKNRFIKYDNRVLMLTAKGYKSAAKKDSEISPYIDLYHHIQKDDHRLKTLQTRFKSH